MLSHENQVFFTLGNALKDCYAFDSNVDKLVKEGLSTNAINPNIVSTLEEHNNNYVLFLTLLLKGRMSTYTDVKNAINSRDFLIHRFAYENYNMLDNMYYERKLIILIKSHHKNIMKINHLIEKK
ncbi:hypothetical protein AB192_00985 [Aliivibrio fischeri]|nr:hypothetical protein AB192_00985 [Aliivibrio fischeri]